MSLTRERGVADKKGSTGNLLRNTRHDERGQEEKKHEKKESGESTSGGNEAPHKRHKR